jgi:hypothetical protein
MIFVPGCAAAGSGHVVAVAALGADLRVGLRRPYRRSGVLSLRLQAEDIFVGDVVEYPLPEV